MERRTRKELTKEWLLWAFAIAVCLSPLLILLFLAYTAPGHRIDVRVIQPFYVWEDRLWFSLGRWFDRFRLFFLIALGALLVVTWVLQELKQRGR